MDGGPLEDSIQASIVHLLRLRGWVVMEAFKGSARGGVVYSTPGIPDLMAVKAGRIVLLEVKRPGAGRLSPAQKHLHAALLEQGVEVRVVRGLDDVLAVI